jgi:pantetheine-phosphate adenylyltransferase
VRTALYPGTFDPPTLGHVDILQRGLHLFDRIVVAVAESRAKQPLFTVAERVALFREALADARDVEIVPFDSLTVTFAGERGACAILRGLRAVTDFDYEFQLAWMNRKLDSSIETVLLCPNELYTFVNSSLVKEIVRLGGDVAEFVPPGVAKALREKLGRR